jgi:hypothetical protein
MSEELKHTAGVTFNPKTLQLFKSGAIVRPAQSILGKTYDADDFGDDVDDPAEIARLYDLAVANGVLWAASPELLAACQSSERDAQDIADTLERWANELRHGSFASHLVGPMQTMVDGLRHDPSRRKAIANATTAPKGGA